MTTESPKSGPGLARSRGTRVPRRPKMERALKAQNHRALVPESKRVAASDQAFCPPHSRRPCTVLDGHVLQQLSSPGPERAILPLPYTLPVRRHPPIWVIYGGELWSCVRALLTAEALQTGLPCCKHESGRRSGGNTHTLSALGRTIQEDKPSCKRNCWLEMSHACTRRGL